MWERLHRLLYLLALPFCRKNFFFESNDLWLIYTKYTNSSNFFVNWKLGKCTFRDNILKTIYNNSFTIFDLTTKNKRCQSTIYILIFTMAKQSCTRVERRDVLQSWHSARYVQTLKKVILIIILVVITTIMTVTEGWWLGVDKSGVVFASPLRKNWNEQQRVVNGRCLWLLMVV